MSIPTLIISKDRACQLDLLLNSISKNAPDLFDITVIYKTSDNNFRNSYISLRNEWENVQFMDEWNCNDDFYIWLYNHDNPLTAFFTDDCIFYKPCTVWEKDLINLFSMQNLFTFTYRLGDNVTIQDYTIGNPTDRPRLFVEKYDSLLWDYKSVRSDNSFGWSCGLDGYVWRTEDLINLLDDQFLDSFNRLEGLMVRQYQHKKPSACMMACPENSSVFVEQINVVHDSHHHTTGKFNVSLRELNDRFLNGERISLESMDFSQVNCTHGEIPWDYVK